MKVNLKSTVFIILLLAFLYLIINESGLLISNLEGRYVLHSDENCHFLMNDSDTLFLKDDGSLISYNFPGDATYQTETGFFEKKINITFNHGVEGMTLEIERTLFGSIKFRICMDMDEYYIKI